MGKDSQIIEISHIFSNVWIKNKHRAVLKLWSSMSCSSDKLQMWVTEPQALAKKARNDNMKERRIGDEHYCSFLKTQTKFLENK